jgi:Ser-tRNA(Ala) deacylase AlaX
MTQALFRDDAYSTEAEAVVLKSEPRGIALDRTVFYPQGGGQSGDRGMLLLEDGAAIPIVNQSTMPTARPFCMCPPKGPPCRKRARA